MKSEEERSARQTHEKKKPLMYSKERTIILLELNKVEYQLKDLKLFAKRRANQFSFFHSFQSMRRIFVYVIA